MDKATRDDATRVLIIEDDEIYTLGLRATLERFSEQVSIVGNATNVEDAIKKVKELAPDLVLLDLQLPREAGVWSKPKFKHGVDLVQELRKMAENTRILVLSSFGGSRDYEAYEIQPEIVDWAIHEYAHGYIAKDDGYSGERLTGAIERIMQEGETLFSPKVTASYRKTSGNPDREREDRADYKSLTAREFEIATLIVQGKSNKEIARRVNLTEGAVKSHISRGIFSKLGISKRSDPKLRRIVLQRQAEGV